ncbi:hypothetical protein BKA62DRAFT_713281 [Auriculariales sp. MPI-PUGE-AT-0066]|nr:hypothetical protein BKA62DRAFT_713281 [Auriculariales sp. MPI-PUGE-AT-0066]
MHDSSRTATISSSIFNDGLQAVLAFPSTTSQSISAIRCIWLPPSEGYTDPSVLMMHKLPRLRYLAIFLNVDWETGMAGLPSQPNQRLRAESMCYLDLAQMPEETVLTAICLTEHLEVLALFDISASACRLPSMLRLHRLRRVRFGGKLGTTKELKLHELIVRSGISTLRSLAITLDYDRVTSVLASSAPCAVTHLDLISTEFLGGESGGCSNDSCAVNEPARQRDHQRIKKLIEACPKLQHLEMLEFHRDGFRQIMDSLLRPLSSLATRFHECRATDGDERPLLCAMLRQPHPAIANLQVLLPFIYDDQLEELCARRRIALRQYSDLLSCLGTMGRFDSLFGRGNRWI